MEESIGRTTILQVGCPTRPSFTTRTNQESVKVEKSDSSKEGNEIISLDSQGVVVQHQHSTQGIQNRIVLRHLEAIKMNYEGVCVLQSGEDEEKAITLFKKSLACIKSDLASRNSSSIIAGTSEPSRRPMTHWSTTQGLNEIELTRTDPGSVNGPLLASPPLEASNGYHHICPPMIVPVQVHEPSSLDEDLFVYTKAFVFQPCFNHQEPGHPFQNISCPCSVVDSELLSAIIMYNIGLGLHIKSIRTKSWFLKQRSLSLYEMSVGLLRKILKGNKNDNDSHKNDDDNHFVNVTVDSAHQSLTSAICTSLLIACSNNIGHLSYYLQDDYERSRRMTCNLKFLLNLFWARLAPEGHEARRMESTRSRSSSYFMSPLEHADIQGFTWNVRFMLPPTFAPAA